VDRRRGALTTAALAAVPVLFVGVFFAYPVAAILGRGLFPDGSLDLGALGDVFRGRQVEIVWFTLQQATISTALTLAVGIPGAWALSRMRFRGRRIVRALVVVPFVLPTVVVAVAFRALLGTGGPLGSLDLVPSLWAILAAHVFFNYAVVVRVVASLWEHLDPSTEEAARVLGAGRVRTFVSITLPALAPAIAAATAIVFLFTFASFGIVLILGGPGLSTLETEIYRQTALFLDLRTAAALTLVQLGAIVALLTVTGRAQQRYATAQRLRATTSIARRARTAGERLALGANLLVMGVLLGAPLATLALRSLRSTDGALTLDAYRGLDEVRRGPVVIAEPLAAAATSIRYAVLASVLAVVVGGLAAFAIARGRGRSARMLDGALALPLGVSAVTVGFGFLVALDSPPLDLRGSWVLVPIAQAVVAIPLVVRAVTPAIRAIDPHLREAAAVLGAGPRRIWREVDLPIARRALLLGAGFSFAIALGEFGATAFVARPGSTTLPVTIYRLLGQPGPGNFGVALAASVVLMAITAVAILVTDTERLSF